MRIIIKEGWRDRETGKTGDPRINFLSFQQLQDTLSKNAEKLTLQFDINDFDDLKVDQLKNIFKKHKGKKKLDISFFENNEKIKLTRNYNKEIIDVLNNSSSIDTVLNTMGKTRGDLNFNLRDSNWVNFKNEITEICDSKNIRIIEDSVSPAPQGKSEKDLIHWVKKYILN